MIELASDSSGETVAYKAYTFDYTIMANSREEAFAELKRLVNLGVTISGYSNPTP